MGPRATALLHRVKFEAAESPGLLPLEQPRSKAVDMP